MTQDFLQDLEDSCAELNEESTARLAYSFLTCHLKQHKRKIHMCDDDASIERYIAIQLHCHVGTYLDTLILNM